jgi:hypothetical protein
VRHLERHFHCEAHDQPVTTEKKCEIEFMNTLPDTALMSVKERLEQLPEHGRDVRFGVQD